MEEGKAALCRLRNSRDTQGWVKNQKVPQGTALADNLIKLFY